MKKLLEARDLAGMRALLRDDPGAAKKPGVAGVAAGMAWKEALALLVQHGADLNASYRGYRPLHALIQESPHAEGGSPAKSRIECFEWMLDRGADPELMAAWPPARAVIIAAFAGVAEYVTILRGRGVEENVFVSAALGDARAVARHLKKDAADATARDGEGAAAGHCLPGSQPGGLTALQCAAGSKLGAKDAKTAAGLIESAKTLIEAGADVNAITRSWGDDVNATYFAVHNDAMYELLLDHGADPTAALPPAVWRERYHLAEMAMARGGDINAPADDGKPMLNQMVRWGQLKQAFWLLEQGASPNAADERGWTAVHQAASRGNERLMRAVLVAGGDRSRRDRSGHTPLQVARAMGRSKMVRILGG